jgi:hypothetical protein
MRYCRRRSDPQERSVRYFLCRRHLVLLVKKTPRERE